MKIKLTTFILFFLSNIAYADSYDPATNQLTIPTITVAGTTYNNVITTVGRVLSYNTGTAGLADSYDSTTNILTIPSITVGDTTYSNVKLTVGKVLSYDMPNSSQLKEGESTVVSQIKSINTSSVASHVLVIKKDNTVWGWGVNDAGQVGPQSPESIVTTPVQVTTLKSDFVSATTGYKRSFAFGPSTYMYAWGWNYSGTLGDGTTTLRITPVQTAVVGGFTSVASAANFTVAVRSDGSLWGWGSGVYLSPFMPYKPNKIGSGFKTVTAGNGHVVALKTDGSVWTWGMMNDYGQLGRIVQTTATGETDARTPTQILTGVSQVWAGGYSGYAMKTDGTLWAWGSNVSGQLEHFSVS